MLHPNIRREIADRRAESNGAADDNPAEKPPTTSREVRPLHKSVRRRAERVKRSVRLQDIIANYSDLQPSGALLVGQCPFHDDVALSLSVYPRTNGYWCNVCGAAGDVLRFVMDKESMTLGQALEALERFIHTHELYGTS